MTVKRTKTIAVAMSLIVNQGLAVSFLLTNPIYSSHVKSTYYVNTYVLYVCVGATATIILTNIPC